MSSRVEIVDATVTDALTHPVASPLSFSLSSLLTFSRSSFPRSSTALTCASSSLAIPLLARLASRNLC